MSKCDFEVDLRTSNLVCTRCGGRGVHQILSRFFVRRRNSKMSLGNNFSSNPSDTLHTSSAV
uniref:Uncharacterized protein n=1 Tax=Physcomitrium patens TaxID=3218 RepID=A0A2K1KUL2_PHYPA|nr:hypothetical protein PHYPA_004471 [Physcomitrium patens]